MSKITLGIAVISLGGVMCVLCGCKSRPLGPYSSPRVTGQVLVAGTDQPLAHTTVIRGARKPDVDSPAKGAELLVRQAPARTGSDGRFTIPGYRVLSVIRGSGWSQVQLIFEHPRFLRLRATYPLAMATNSANGEPLLDVGKVFLTPEPP